MSACQTNTLARILGQDFDRRKKRKESYSLRSYAKYLGLSPSTLHSLMSEDSMGSPKLVEKIARKIGLNESEEQYVSHVSRLKNTKDPKKKKEILQKAVLLNTRFNTLTVEEYQLIGKWYYYPVMELIKTKGAVLDPAWIGKKLGITSEEARLSLESLQKLDIIEIKNNQLIVKRDYVELPDGTFLPGRELNQTLIQKAKEAALVQPKGTRSFSNTVVRFRKSDIKRAQEFITRFRREFCLEFESGRDHDSVYDLNVNFFRLDEEGV